jgi:hypothetical protein
VAPACAVTVTGLLPMAEDQPPPPDLRPLQRSLAGLSRAVCAAGSSGPHAATNTNAATAPAPVIPCPDLMPPLLPVRLVVRRVLGFAPDDRARCEGCGLLLRGGSCCVTKYVYSQQHGEDIATHHYHISCRGHGAVSLASIENLGGVRFVDQMQLLAHIGVPVSKDTYENYGTSDKVFALADRLTVPSNKPPRPPAPSLHRIYGARIPGGPGGSLTAGCA